MTINQLNSLTDEELDLCLYIINETDPIEYPKIEYSGIDLTWVKHQFLVQHLLNAFPKLKPEGHNVFKSLLEKMGVSITIEEKKQEPKDEVKPEEPKDLPKEE